MATFAYYAAAIFGTTVGGAYWFHIGWVIRKIIKKQPISDIESFFYIQGLLLGWLFLPLGLYFAASIVGWI